MSREYEEFCRRAGELADLEHAQGLLSWDQETCMPAGGTAMRARSQGTLAGLYHERLTDGPLVELVERLGEQELEEERAAHVRELRREQQRALKIPRELVVELRRTESLAHEAWVEARARSAFAPFKPWLEKILKLQREVAERVGYEGELYNALLDAYEPDARAEQIGPLFAELRARLVPLVERIAATGRFPARGVLDGEFPIESQERFSRQVVGDMGFDWGRGRLDVAVHPFCSGLASGDVRLTTRYRKDWLPGSLFGSIHEAGHGLYEQGLPEKLAGLPAGRSVSLGIHESQSRLWENMIGRSRSFWKHYLPRLAELFPEPLKGVDVDAFYAAVNQVAPSPIRVEADEVTYNLHILLRFELERMMLEGEVAVEDLPALWNERMESYLGIRPEDDARGVLQDVHWSLGLIGYFPTYALGNLYAAQFFHRAQQQMPDLMAQVEAGNLLGLRDWLREHIHVRGRLLRAGELVEEVTGEKLQARYFGEYLEEKFTALYGL